MSATGREPLRRDPFTLLAVAVLLLALLELFGSGLLRGLEYALHDQLLALHTRERLPDGQTVIVDIDERSLEAMAVEHGRYPWPRSVHAELVEAIAAQRPRAILFDILFTDPDPLRPDDDAYLAEVAATHDNLFFPFIRLQSSDPEAGVPLALVGEALGFSQDGAAPPQASARVPLLLPYTAAQMAGRLGSINFSADSDGIARHYPLYHPVEGWRLPSLPAKAATALGYPLPEAAQIRLNWQGPALSYPRFSYSDLYADLSRREPQRPPDEFRDKVVIIGATAPALHDLRSTPLSSLHPAVEILATTLDNLRLGNPLRDAPRWLPAFMALLLIIALWHAFLQGRSPLRIGLLMLGVTPLVVLLSYLLLGSRVWLPLFTPLLFAWLYYGLAALSAYRSERAERQRSVAIFSRFLDPRVVNELVAKGESALDLKSESRQITVLFSDIRGFTTLSEKHTAEEIVALLNNYFSRQVEVIFRHGGTMDKFIGDAIMAFWGAPVADELQACHAVAAALDMADALQAFKAELGAADENFDVGIGIHSGPGVVGFIGSHNRLDYTAIGDTVNLASRIEGQTKGVARILVSGETRAQCGEAFDFTDHGFYKVKGRTQEVRLYEPRRKLS
ncbi:MAG: adenylate/guanylate cyclase domain-containing protein [Gammaproteobacteria bacterium]|nr:adenylate/guanylate cyclase domain-containing protein [Gammaproteobacteria bacterium]